VSSCAGYRVAPWFVRACRSRGYQRAYQAISAGDACLLPQSTKCGEGLGARGVGHRSVLRHARRIPGSAGARRPASCQRSCRTPGSLRPATLGRSVACSSVGAARSSSRQHLEHFRNGRPAAAGAPRRLGGPAVCRTGGRGTGVNELAEGAPGGSLPASCQSATTSLETARTMTFRLGPKPPAPSGSRIDIATGPTAGARSEDWAPNPE